MATEQSPRLGSPESIEELLIKIDAQLEPVPVDEVLLQRAFPGPLATEAETDKLLRIFPKNSLAPLLPPIRPNIVTATPTSREIPESKLPTHFDRLKLYGHLTLFLTQVIFRQKHLENLL